MNTQITKTTLLLASILLLCTSFGPLKALSLYDLEKRPSLKIAGIKILHNGKKIIVGTGNITNIENIDVIIPLTDNITSFDSANIRSIAIELPVPEKSISAFVNALKHDPQLKTLQEVILVVWSDDSDAETKAQKWLTALNNAIYGQDTNYRTLVGATH